MRCRVAPKLLEDPRGWRGRCDDPRSGSVSASVTRFIIILSLLLAGRAAADIPVPTYLPDWTANNIVVNQIVRDAHRPLFERDRKPASTRRSTITRGTSTAARQLAAAYPVQHRRDVLAAFVELLAKYAQLERQLGIEAGDAAGAMSLFIVANVEAYRGQPVDAATYAPVLAQVRERLATSAAFAKLSRARQRELYEQLAIIGMLMAATPPTPQRKAAAAGYLAGLGLDPETVTITTAGLGT